MSLSINLHRRHFLQSSAACTLSFLLPALDLRAAQRRGSERQKSIIVLWMQGGPSQLESWDPHPGTSIGGPTQAISTSIPDLKIASLLPRMADQMQHLSVIRSLVSKEGDHERGTYYLTTGYRPDPTVRHPSLGSILSAKLPDSKIEIPLHVSVGEAQWVPWGGYLGDEYSAFRILNVGEDVRNLRPPVEQARQDRRQSNLKLLTDSFRKGRSKQLENTLHEHVIDRALTMMSSSQLKAFRLDSETAATKARYGDTPFGRGCLVARRLVEEGVRAVQVVLPGFDTHANNFEGQKENMDLLDPGFSALVADLVERDLWDSTVVVCLGEFGRTPTINPLEGRDHWPTGFSCVLGGGGLIAGQVIGQTDPQGLTKDPKNPVQVEDLMATLLAVMGLDSNEEIQTPIGRPIKLSEGTPIGRLFKEAKQA